MSLKETMARRLSVDPAYGVGLVILGILVMGISGAATWHYVFNIGTGIALLGALTFVVGVAVHALTAAAPEVEARSSTPETTAS